MHHVQLQQANFLLIASARLLHRHRPRDFTPYSCFLQIYQSTHSMLSSFTLSSASSVVDAGGISTLSPFFQSAGVATLCSSEVCNAVTTRTISSMFRPVESG